MYKNNVFANTGIVMNLSSLWVNRKHRWQDGRLELAWWETRLLGDSALILLDCLNVIDASPQIERMT